MKKQLPVLNDYIVCVDISLWCILLRRKAPFWSFLMRPSICAHYFLKINASCLEKALFPKYCTELGEEIFPVHDLLKKSFFSVGFNGGKLSAVGSINLEKFLPCII